MYVYLPYWAIYFLVGGWILTGVCAFYIHHLMFDYEKMRGRQRVFEQRLTDLENWRYGVDCEFEDSKIDYFPEIDKDRRFAPETEPDIPNIVG